VSIPWVIALSAVIAAVFWVIGWVAGFAHTAYFKNFDLDRHAGDLQSFRQWWLKSYNERGDTIVRLQRKLKRQGEKIARVHHLKRDFIEWCKEEAKSLEAEDRADAAFAVRVCAERIHEMG
jgi:hypothetical protein